ncbi:MAG: ATP synthase F1 subunit delta [Candidatus Eisenbacteria bacterium]
MLSNPVARRYSRALFSAAAARDRLDPVLRDVEAVAAFLRTDPGARRLLLNSPISTQERQALTVRMFSGRAEPLVVELLGLLLEKKRCGLLDDVAADFRERYEQERGILRVEVTSAIPLPAELEQRLKDALGRHTGKQVRLELRVAPHLLGGLQVRIGDRVIERSVRRSLEAMRATLWESAVHE